MRVISSSAAKGSSISSTRAGSPARARSRRASSCRPTVRADRRWRSRQGRPASSASSICASRAARRDMPRSRSGSQTLSNTVAHGISVGSWNTKPMSARLRRWRQIDRAGLPSACTASPAMIRSTVDLPQPDGPSRREEFAFADCRGRGRERGDAVGEDLADAAQEPAPAAGDRRTGAIAAKRSDTDQRRPIAAGPSHELSPRSARPIISARRSDADALVDELQRVGLLVVEPALIDASLHHLVEEMLHPRIGHRADAELSARRRNRPCHIPSSWRTRRRSARRSCRDCPS